MGIGFGKKNKEINKVVLLPLAEIQKSTSQPRTDFDEESLQELARSIAVNGLLQPITVRKIKENRYELIAGERRTLAFKSLGRETIPAIIEECSSAQSAVFSLIENLQRKDLNYFEEANGIAKMMHELELNQIQVSQKLGKAQSTIANKLRLLKYSPEVQRLMLDAGFSERHARALLRLPNEIAQQQAIDAIVANCLNVEQTEQLVKTMLSEAPHKTGTRLFVVKDMRMFMNSIQKAISTMNQAGIPVESSKSESDSCVELTIRIPKSSVYRDKLNRREQPSLAR